MSPQNFLESPDTPQNLLIFSRNRFSQSCHPVLIVNLSCDHQFRDYLLAVRPNYLKTLNLDLTINGSSYFSSIKASLRFVQRFIECLMVDKIFLLI